MDSFATFLRLEAQTPPTAFRIVVGTQRQSYPSPQDAARAMEAVKRLLVTMGWTNNGWTPADNGQDVGAGVEYTYEKSISGTPHEAAVRMLSSTDVTVGIYPADRT